MRRLPIVVELRVSDGVTGQVKVKILVFDDLSCLISFAHCNRIKWKEEKMNRNWNTLQHHP